MGIKDIARRMLESGMAGGEWSARGLANVVGKIVGAELTPVKGMHPAETPPEQEEILFPHEWRRQELAYTAAGGDHETLVIRAGHGMLHVSFIVPEWMVDREYMIEHLRSSVVRELKAQLGALSVTNNYVQGDFSPDGERFTYDSIEFGVALPPARS